MVKHRKENKFLSLIVLFTVTLLMALSMAALPLRYVQATTNESITTPSGQPSVIDLTAAMAADEMRAAQVLASQLGYKYEQDVVLIISNFAGDQEKMDAELERIIYSSVYGYGENTATTVFILDNFNYLSSQAISKTMPNDTSNPLNPPSTAEIQAIIADINENYDYLKSTEIVRQVLYSYDYIMAQRTGSPIEENPFLPAEVMAAQNAILADIYGKKNTPELSETANIEAETSLAEVTMPEFSIPIITMPEIPDPGTETVPTETVNPRDLLPKGNNTSANIVNTVGGGPALLDPENILSASQQESLSAKALAVGQKYGVDVVLAIMTTDTGQSAMANADDLYDYGEYSPDGVLGLIDIANRTVWISTSGTAIKMLPNTTLDRIAQNVVDRNSLGNQEYAGAMNSLMAGIEDKLADTRPRLKAMDIGIAVGAAFIVFLIFFGITNSAYKQPKGAKRQIDMRTQAIADYDDIRDNLIDTKLTSAIISSASSGGSRGGGGGGGMHTGSSGRSHGGGGASW